MLRLERVNMLTVDQVTQAFVKAIETVGMSGFKRTSMFMRNNSMVDTKHESDAA